jgi:hypothetical protein
METIIYIYLEVNSQIDILTKGIYKIMIHV